LAARCASLGTPPRIASRDGFSSTGSSLDVHVTGEVAGFARRSRLLEDPEGATVVVRLETVEAVADLVRYAYGDARESSAVRSRIEERLARFR